MVVVVLVVAGGRTERGGDSSCGCSGGVDVGGVGIGADGNGVALTGRVSLRNGGW